MEKRQPIAKKQIAAVLPAIVCGPIVRRLTDREMVVWLVSSHAEDIKLQVSWDTGAGCQRQETTSSTAQAKTCIQIGEHAFIRLLHIQFAAPLPPLCTLEYDIYRGANSETSETDSWLYDGETRPTVVYKKHLDSLLHGTCRKPHSQDRDALVQADKLLSNDPSVEARPALLMLAGDQIYADDVAGPFLYAIHQTMALLGLFSEQFQGAVVDDSEALASNSLNYYQRVALLPDDDANETLEKRFFKGKRKPIFTSVHAQNHLITSAEVFAMYLLSWSPSLWALVDLDSPPIKPEFMPLYRQERVHIDAFVEDLQHAQRIFAHLPTYMIFDDHDITDDWNLTQGWEVAAYNNPYSRRIIGNALIGYWLFQGIGNNPAQYAALQAKQSDWFSNQGITEHDNLIDSLLKWRDWDFELPTEPGFIVLDTRTHRWRSDVSPAQPSGLMDHAALSKFHKQLQGKKKVILVSPAPVFGVQCIEAVQKAFTLVGGALVVDAENWMAHSDTQERLFDILASSDTANDIAVLSGDVHYSYVYDAVLSNRHTQQEICVQQITCSGIKNSFPAKLLRVLERLNSWLFHRPQSNRAKLTAHKMKQGFYTVNPRLPHYPTNPASTLINKSAIGHISITPEQPGVQLELLCGDGSVVSYHSRKTLLFTP